MSPARLAANRYKNKRGHYRRAILVNGKRVATCEDTQQALRDMFLMVTSVLDAIGMRWISDGPG